MGLSEPTGRIKDYLKQGEDGKLRPYSCIIRQLPSDITDFAKFFTQITKDLCSGAGVKINLDTYEEMIQGLGKSESKFAFYLDESHPDYEQMLPRQTWHFNPDKNLIEFTLEDSMFGDKSISIYWEHLINSYVWYGDSDTGERVYDFSKLRPNGTVNKVGMIASGPVGDGVPTTYSFVDIYIEITRFFRQPSLFNLITLFGVLNDCSRRGGYKKGIICTSLSINSSNLYTRTIQEYIELHNSLIPGGHKKSYRLTDADITPSNKVIHAIANDVNEGGSFIEFVKPGEEDYYANVCVGIKQKINDTCLIWRLNFGKVETPHDIINGLVEVAYDLTNLHYDWRTDKDIDDILPLTECDQIGLDFIGLASMLAKFEVSYERFTWLLEDFVKSKTYLHIGEEWQKHFEDWDIDHQLVYALWVGLVQAREMSFRVSKSKGFKPLSRIFTVEPSQRHFLDLVDTKGYTVTRSIFPPLHSRIRRNSAYETEQIVEFNPEVETLPEVTPEGVLNFSAAFKALLDLTGVAHGYMSYDSYLPMTPKNIYELHAKGLESKYYTEAHFYNQGYLVKKVQVVDLGDDAEFCDVSRPDECSVCSE